MRANRPKYEIGETNGQQWLECMTCHMKTYNRADIEYRYCGKCHRYLDAVFGAQRKAPETSKRQW